MDVDGQTGNDDPGTSARRTTIPALKVDFDGDGTATVAEFGAQRRPGPVTSLAATRIASALTVTWAAPTGVTVSTATRAA